MIDPDTDLLVINDTDHVVLRAYSVAEQRLAAASPSGQHATDGANETSRWVARIRHIEGVPEDRMAPIHGRLIACGYLHFQLQGREAGVVYRLTPEGRAALSGGAGESQIEQPIRRSA